MSPQPIPPLGDSEVKTNPKLSERLRKMLAEYGWIAAIVGVIGAYLIFVWQVNAALVARADVERELQGQISELKGKLDILLIDRHEPIDKVIEQRIQVESSPQSASSSPTMVEK